VTPEKQFIESINFRTSLDQQSSISPEVCERLEGALSENQPECHVGAVFQRKATAVRIGNQLLYRKQLYALLLSVPRRQSCFPTGLHCTEYSQGKLHDTDHRQGNLSYHPLLVDDDFLTRLQKRAH